MATTRETSRKIGDWVRVKQGRNHDQMTAGKVGKIVGIGGIALAIKFEGMEKPHLWYTDLEVDDVPPNERFMRGMR